MKKYINGILKFNVISAMIIFILSAFLALEKPKYKIFDYRFHKCNVIDLHHNIPDSLKASKYSSWTYEFQIAGIPKQSINDAFVKVKVITTFTKIRKTLFNIDTYDYVKLSELLKNEQN